MPAPKDPKKYALYIKRLRESHKGQKHTQKWKDVMKVRMKGERNPNFGKPGLKDELNPTWKGDEAGYRAKHEWVASRLGKHHYCSHCRNTGLRHRQYQWANISGKYKRNLSDWIRLCSVCHSKFDRLPRKSKMA